MLDTDNNEVVPEEFETTGEDNVDDVELEEVEEVTDNKLKQLREKLKACEEEKRTHLEELQRTKADYLNSKKRLEEQQKTMIERATASHIEDLLPLADSFTMAMANKEAWEAVDADWRTGIEGIYTQLQAILAMQNVTEIPALDMPFDPNLHEAVSSVDSDKESEIVIEVVQKGYQRNDLVIRPAKVIISN